MNADLPIATDANESGALSVDNLPLPVILISPARTLVAANKMARDIFEGFEEGKDLSLMIRYPRFLEACAEVFETGEARECEIVKTGRRRRTFQARISPFNTRAGDGEEKGAFIALHETTAASDAQRMRSAFVADVSHELRSPLTTLIATIETLEGQAGRDDDTRARFIQLMAHEAGRMRRIVDDLLSLSATESQEHILPEDKVELSSIVEDVAAVLTNVASEKGMSIRLEVEDGLPATRGNYDALYQVVHNLVDNAIKYGQADTTISLKAESEGERVYIEVNNSGPPIAKEHIPRLTERFYRVDKSRSRDLGGTGLGLAIAKHIVNRHLGRLRIKSSATEGTSFTIQLPVKK
jgi:two-component system, OmpR family, phosphate regulon sensor histidine kinase PhoR